MDNSHNDIWIMERASERTDRSYDQFLIECARKYFFAPFGTTADKAAEMFDGNEGVNGYSLDAMYERYRDGCTSDEAISCLPA